MENDQVKKPSGRIWAGLFVLGIGIALLLDRIGFYLPGWLFTWPMILIALGVFIGLKHNFRGGAWLVMIIIGGIFLTDFTIGLALRKYIWPMAIIVIGLFMILRPRRHRMFGDWENRFQQRFKVFQSHDQPLQQTYPTSEETKSDSSQPYGGEDYLDAVAVFGGIKKIILSKNFKGGEAVSVFGGTDLDLSRADIQGTVSLELTQIFGGTKLIVPSHWEIKSEVVAFLGGIDDKRNPHNVTVDPTKVLLLKGTSVLGGIDIRNF